MRLWTLNPRYLDAKGLVALWRESLLARAVLQGKTHGYRNHPQLIRFRNHREPLKAIDEYLLHVLAESRLRGYQFDASKLPARRRAVSPIVETRGQLDFEWQHLLAKLERRSPQRFSELCEMASPEPHPLFKLVPGGVRSWEKITTGRAKTTRTDP